MGKRGWKQWLSGWCGGGHPDGGRRLRLAPAPAFRPSRRLAVGNGRIEATEIDIATKTAGRIKEILVNDGDVIEAGQVVARMDTQTLEAELRQAQAQVRQAQQAKATAAAVVVQREHAKATAAAVVVQREHAKVTATAVVAQRDSELALAEKDLARSQPLALKGAITLQQLDADYTKQKSATTRRR